MADSSGTLVPKIEYNGTQFNVSHTALTSLSVRKTFRNTTVISFSQKITTSWRSFGFLELTNFLWDTLTFPVSIVIGGSADSLGTLISTISGNIKVGAVDVFKDGHIANYKSYRKFPGILSLMCSSI